MGLHLNFKLRMDASTAASAAHAMLADLHKLANTLGGQWSEVPFVQPQRSRTLSR